MWKGNALHLPCEGVAQVTRHVCSLTLIGQSYFLHIFSLLGTRMVSCVAWLCSYSPAPRPQAEERGVRDTLLSL